MTRFLYIADPHLGADPVGYHQQSAYPERVPDILASLDAWIQQMGNLDFVLHGGDMVDVGTPDMIRYASDVFRLSIPIHLCLGNHDLTERDSLEHWLSLAPEFFPGGGPEYSIESTDCTVQVVPNHWGDVPYYWDGPQNPGFSADQLRALRKRNDASSPVPQLLLTHSPVYGVPPEQTGFDEPYHSPGEPFAEAVGHLVAADPRIQCVLGAHTHLNMNLERGGVNYVTVSALSEAPFEFKLFEITPDVVSMTTVSLLDRLPFTVEYDDSKTFVQGRKTDREFSRRLSG